MTWKHKASVWRKGCSLKAEQSRREGEKDEGGEEQRGRREVNAPGMGGADVDALWWAWRWRVLGSSADLERTLRCWSRSLLHPHERQMKARVARPAVRGSTALPPNGSTALGTAPALHEVQTNFSCTSQPCPFLGRCQFPLSP